MVDIIDHKIVITYINSRNTLVSLGTHWTLFTLGPLRSLRSSGSIETINSGDTFESNGSGGSLESIKTWESWLTRLSLSTVEPVIAGNTINTNTIRTNGSNISFIPNRAIDTINAIETGKSVGTGSTGLTLGPYRSLRSNIARLSHIPVSSISTIETIIPRDTWLTLETREPGNTVITVIAIKTRFSL